jgi:hypothetical protein
MEGTHLLLSLLWEAGYKVSRKKAQICQNTVKYLGFHLSQGAMQAWPDRKLAVCPSQPPRPASKSESFWEPQVFAKSGSLTTPSWPNPSMKPQRGKKGTFSMGKEQEKAFKEIKRVLTNALALSLPDVMKPFFL